MGLLSPKLYVDVLAKREKSDFFYTNFFAELPTHQYTNFDRKAPILTKLSDHYYTLLKIHQIFNVELL